MGRPFRCQYTGVQQSFQVPLQGSPVGIRAKKHEILYREFRVFQEAPDRRRLPATFRF